MIKWEKKFSEKLNEYRQEGVNEYGLKIIVVPKKFTKSYAIIGTKYGSNDSSFNGTVVPDGIAHFLEHKLFEQPNGGNAFDEFAKTGANSNAFTSFTQTCYLFSATEHIDENLRILLNFVYSPYFTDENVAKEQGIIGQEIKMYDDEPNWRVFFNCLGLMFKNYPVRKDIAGTATSISQITPATLNVCYNTFYHPSNMVLVCVGDFTPEGVEAILGEELKKVNISKSYREIERDFPKEPKEVAGKEKVQKLDVGMPLFMIGFKGRVDHPVRSASTPPEEGNWSLQHERIVSEIAMECVIGRTSHLFENLYESGLINDSFSAEYSAEIGYSYMAIGGESTRPREVFDEIKKAIAFGLEVSEEDFKRVKSAMLGAFYREFNDSESLGRVYLDDALVGIDTFGYVGELEEVSLGEVRSRVKELFNGERMVLSIVNS